MDQYLAGRQRLAEYQLVPLQQADLCRFGLAGQLALTACRVNCELLTAKQLFGIEGQVDRRFLHDAQQDRCRGRNGIAEGVHQRGGIKQPAAECDLHGCVPQ
ncbi:hypothetical protein D3C84_495970 [compost metagenome]